MASSRTAIRGLMALMAAGAMAAAPSVAFADSLTQVNLDCGDGSPLNALVARVATLNGIQADVSEMALSPAGLSCTLSTTPITVTTSLTTSTTTSSPSNGSPTTGSPTSNDQDGFASGAGRYNSRGTAADPNPPAGCIRNFALKAHFNEDSSTPGAARGKSNVTQPDQGPNCPAGHIESSVNCLNIGTDTSGNRIAEVVSTVTEVDGFFAQAGINQGDTMATDVTAGNNEDNDDPSKDAIVHRVSTPTSPETITCTAQDGTHPLIRGHITIHQENSAEEDD